MKPAVLKPIVQTVSKTCPSGEKVTGRVTARVPIRLQARIKELMAEDAVGYRTPMEVTHILKLPGECYYPVCPRCKSSVDREYMRYCDRCGQKLGWKRIKEAIIVYPGYNKE